MQPTFSNLKRRTPRNSAARALVLLAAGLPALLAGCAGAGEDGPPQDTGTSQEALVDGYNLVVASMSPLTVAPGSSVIFSATLQNTGNVATPAGIIHGVSFWVNGTQVSWSDTHTGSLAPGASVTVTSNHGPTGTRVWTAPSTPGTHTLVAEVDDINRMPAETNEGDNELSASLSVTASATCSDRVRNGTETGVDCGPDCGPCEWPFTAVPRATLRQSARKVYAHWHYYPVSMDNHNPTTNDYYERAYIAVNGENGTHAPYGGFMRERPIARPTRPEADWQLRDAKDEIQLAARIGIDGFYLNLWTDSDTNNGGVWTRVRTIVDAASQLGGFDIVPNFDMTILNTGSASGDQDAIIRILGKLKGFSALQRRPDGKYVVGLFNPNAQGRTAAFYGTVKQRAASELGMSLYLVPVFLGTGSTALFEEYRTVGDAYAGWGTAVPVSTAGYSGALKTKAAGYGKSWMHPMSSQDYRPKDRAFWEARNSLTLRSIWENVIADGLDQVQIVTWNDQHEHHNIRPSTGKQWPAYDMTAYYIQWFKTGVRPTIERDVLYYNHRIHNAALVPTTQTSTNLATCRAGCPASNDVELVGFLRSAGRLEITQGATTYGVDKTEGGVQAIRTAMATGTPTFRLRRSGATVVQFQSMHGIVGSIAYQDLLYRAGSSSRAALPSCATSCSVGEARCLMCPGEPLWLKR
ncbi:endo-1,3-alpha-glucanase family glycosylhydrolase [Pyxidicoccus sp. 3LFB2]